MKKSIWASFALAGLAFCSCTQDEVLMSEADEANERAQIQALAEEYGLEVRFDEAARMARSATEPLNMDSVEAEMKAFASLAGEYTCLAQRGDTAIFGRPTSATTPVKRLTRGFLEGWSKSFEETVDGPYGAIMLKITCSVSSQGGPNVEIEFVSGMVADVGVRITQKSAYGFNYVSFEGDFIYYDKYGREYYLHFTGYCNDNGGRLYVGNY